MSSKSDLGLQRVQDLYAMHMELVRALSADLSNPDVRKEIQKRMREFGSLLAKVDYRYMGGEDVLEAMREFPREVRDLLRYSPPARAVSNVKARTAARSAKAKMKIRSKPAKSKAKTMKGKTPKKRRK